MATDAFGRACTLLPSSPVVSSKPVMKVLAVAGALNPSTNPATAQPTLVKEITCYWEQAVTLNYDCCCGWNPFNRCCTRSKTVSRYKIWSLIVNKILIGTQYSAPLPTPIRINVGVNADIIVLEGKELKMATSLCLAAKAKAGKAKWTPIPKTVSC